MADHANTYLATRSERTTSPVPRLELSALMPPEDHYRPRKRSPAARSFAWFLVSMMGTVALLWSTSSMAAVMAFFFVVFAATYYQRHTQLRAVEENHEAIQLLNDGHVDEAARLFEHLSHSEQRTYGHAVFVHNRAVTYLLQGRLKRAYSLFNAVDRSGHFRWGPNRAYEPLLYVEMASCLALMGSMREAHGFRERAILKLGPEDRARILIVDAIIGLREKRVGDVANLIPQLPQAREVLRTPTYRALLVLCAFAHLKANGTRGRDVAGQLLDAAKPYQRGEFDYLGAEWAEFRSFLNQQGLWAGATA